MKFWMVVCNMLAHDSFNHLQHPGPKYIHETELEAEKEAERLALKHPGKEFVVLESISSVKSVGLIRNLVRWDRNLPRS